MYFNPYLLAILIIGGGYMLSRAIFSAWPLKKEQLEDEETKSISISMWIVGFGIIIGQLIYIWIIMENFFSFVDPVRIPLFLIRFVVIGLYSFLLYKHFIRN